jgi:hypothetical protein
VAVTAGALARELKIRADNIIQGGTGISITSQTIELPGGDPTDTDDDIIQYTASIGLPENSDVVTLAGLRLGDPVNGQVVSSIVNSVVGINQQSTSDEKVVTEKALRNFVQTQIAAGVASAVPPGIILMWSGAIADIPPGWGLCNGANGTPNLRDRFIVGAGSGYSPGAAAGSANAVVVSHSHAASSSPHTHPSSETARVIGPTIPSIQAAGTLGLAVTQFPPGQSAVGSETVTVTVDSEGVSGVNANLPPYFALAFIMKLA